ncbi:MULTISPECIES: hypothetical protein [Chryseobacterium]|uniref:hypothetical protein n=1 Tax=Chryseobacterium TaxID=59732 RepID=UPI002221B266|nr:MULTISPECIES: hypothetical protein [Chryseobacterium]MCW1961489.1 hypothetical protein [Chryseobacterium viscerum]MDC8099478.1 hypothetical protein [Chryseobacterium rhizosphaerae]WPO92640.1 hypothetical protein SFA27_08055 [Chryseobacterium sp. HR92]
MNLKATFRQKMEYDIFYYETLKIFKQHFLKDYDYHTKGEITFIEYLEILKKNYWGIVDDLSEIIDLHSDNFRTDSYDITDDKKELRRNLLFELSKYFEFYEILQKVTNKKYEHYFLNHKDMKNADIYFIEENSKLFLEGAMDEMIGIKAEIENKIKEFELISIFINANKSSKILNPNKILVKGSLQSIGYLFSELIEKGFIEAPKRNGKDNTSAISRMILDHFEFIDKEEQPKPEDIRKTLFTENKLSIEKQNQFKIPQSKIINTD